MKTKRFFTGLMILIISLIAVNTYAGDSTFTKIGEFNQGNGLVQVWEYKHQFTADSLARKVSNVIPLITASTDSLIGFSITASGTTKNFTINTYLTNLINSSTAALGDTASWNLLASYDTTGLYTNKPVNKVVVPRISALSFAGIAFMLKGAAGNREDVIVTITLYMRKE